MYYLLFFVPILLYPLQLPKRIKGILSALAMLGVAVFRFGAGADYFSYSYLYYLIPESSLAKAISALPDQEIGIKLLMFPFRFFNLPYEIFVAFMAILITVLVYLWIEKNTESSTLSYLVYYSFFFLVWNLSSLRQGLALTLGVYLLMNVKYTWRFTSKLLIVAGLYFIHKTSLVFLVLLASELMHWDRKKLMLLVAASLIASLLPVGELAVWLAKVPVFSRLSYYLGTADSYGFWDFKSLPRLFLIALALYHYDALVKRQALPKRVLDTYVVGLSIFFFLRFDDLIAARLSIYGFFLAILVLPAIVDLYDKTKLMKGIAFGGLAFMCALYLEKELLAMAGQAGIAKYGYYVPYTTVFDQGTATFNNTYFYANNYQDFLDKASCRLEIIHFENTYVPQSSEIKNPAKYLAAKFPSGEYGLIDVEGNVVLSGRFGPIEYYGGIIRENADAYYDVTGKPLDTRKAAMIFFTAKAQTRKYISDKFTWFEIGRDVLDNELITALEEEGQFKFLNIVNQVDPLDFNMIEYLSYRHKRVFRLYDKDMNLMSEDYFLDAKNILVNRIVKATNVCGTKFYNENGKLIWMQMN